MINIWLDDHFDANNNENRNYFGFLANKLVEFEDVNRIAVKKLVFEDRSGIVIRLERKPNGIYVYLDE